MNKQSLITATILALLFIGTSFYNSNYGIGRYAQITVLGGHITILDTKTGKVYHKGRVQSDGTLYLPEEYN